MTRTSGRSDIVDVHGTLVHETAGAFLIDHGGDKPVWVPKAAVEHDPDDGTFAMPRRLAEEKGLV